MKQSETSAAKGRYTFGTTPEAAERLEVLASFFNPRAESWIRSHCAEPVEIAIDLGCGPGWTTAMLSQACEAKQTVGMDRSLDFLRFARRRHPGCRFLAVDLAQGELPLSPSLAYARFLLPHIPGGAELPDRWAKGLAPGGLLLVEEGAAIVSDLPVFQRYISVAERLIASQGGDLHIGRHFAPKSFHAEVAENTVTEFPVENARAASWFLHNVRNLWRASDFVRNEVCEEERGKIEAEFLRLRDTGGTGSNIFWRMARLVLRKRGA